MTITVGDAESLNNHRDPDMSSESNHRVCPSSAILFSLFISWIECSAMTYGFCGLAE